MRRLLGKGEQRRKEKTGVSSLYAPIVPSSAGAETIPGKSPQALERPAEGVI
jgi:hypothetical protein